MVRPRATPTLAHVRSKFWSYSEENDVEEDCTTNPVAADGLAPESGFRADCQGQKAEAIRKDEVCS